MIEIKHRWTGAVIYRSESAVTLRDAVIEAVKASADLESAYLAGADLAGADLASADLAGANLASANLADADLADANLAGANLASANLAGANLAGADLASANLASANLADADLADANLAGANLASAKNLPAGIAATDPPEPYVRLVGKDRYARRAERYRARHPDVPVVPNLDSRILEMVDGGTGTLEMRTWHTCETTHCRAGWAITLAGEAGKKLEEQFGPNVAGRMIYLASTGRAPHFFATNEHALADIRRCAAEESDSDEPQRGDQ